MSFVHVIALDFGMASARSILMRRCQHTSWQKPVMRIAAVQVMRDGRSCSVFCRGPIQEQHRQRLRRQRLDFKLPGPDMNLPPFNFN